MKKIFNLLDVLISQTLACMLLAHWTWRTCRDLSSGLVFTSTERCPSLLAGVAVAFLLRTAFGRWSFFRWMARTMLAVSVVHILVPFDSLTALAIYTATFAGALDVMISTRQRRSGNIANCSDTRSTEGDRGRDSLRSHPGLRTVSRPVRDLGIASSLTAFEMGSENSVEPDRLAATTSKALALEGAVIGRPDLLGSTERHEG
jgi:hypothetical protein